MSEVTVSGEAAVINGVADEIGENIQRKGFRRDWDLAAELEAAAGENPEIDPDELNDLLLRAAKALRTNVLGMKLALICSEVAGEALETLRDNGGDGVVEGEGNFGEELADAVIRIFDLAHMVRQPIGDEILRKIAVNRERPEMHGRKA